MSPTTSSSSTSASSPKPSSRSSSSRTSAARSRSRPATRSRWRSIRSRTAPARRACRARRPSARAPGRASKRPSTNGEIVTGIISGRVKGGFTVEIENVRAFLPGSLVDVRPVRDTAYLEGKPLEFKVIKLDQKRNNVVVSRRAVVEQEFSAERSALMDNLQEGAVVARHGQEPHRLRCVRRPGRHRRPAAHHRHGLEARQASVRSRQGRR